MDVKVSWEFITKSENTFGGLANFLSSNPLGVKNVSAYYLEMEIRKSEDREIAYQ